MKLKILAIGWGESGVRSVLSIKDVAKIVIHDYPQIEKIEKTLSRKWDLILLCGKLNDEWIKFVRAMDGFIQTTSIAFFEIDDNWNFQELSGNSIIFDERLRNISEDFLDKVVDIIKTFYDNLIEIMHKRIGVLFAGQSESLEDLYNAVYTPYPIDKNSVKDWVIYAGINSMKTYNECLSELDKLLSFFSDQKSSIYWKVTPATCYEIVGIAFF